MNILVKFPTRSRPERFKPTLKQWIDNLSGDHKVRFLVTVDADDLTMNNPQMRGLLEKDKRVVVKVGKSKSKIEAVNDGMEGEEFDLLILASDDMLPKMRGYDAIIAEDMESHFPNMDGALHYPDGFRGEDLCTISIMGYGLYKWFGYIYHPDYRSLWCDNEYTEVAQILGKRVYIPKVVIAHELHHINNAAEKPDELQKKNDGFMGRDRDVFLKRKAKGFDMVKPTLSILIPTLKSRKVKRERLLRELRKQIGELENPRLVEVHLLQDEKEMTVGAKRNVLLDRARGEYVCYVDDDDMVAPEYLKEILKAIKENPKIDCVGFVGLMTTDGENPKEFRFSLKYRGSFSRNGVYYRTPNHLCAIHRGIAKLRRFPEISFGEDAKWAHELYNCGLLKTEYIIEKVLYYYLFEKLGTETQKPEQKKAARHYSPSLVYLRVKIDLATRSDLKTGKPLNLKKGDVVTKVQKKGAYTLVKDAAGRQHAIKNELLESTTIDELNELDVLNEETVNEQVKGDDVGVGGGGWNREDDASKSTELPSGERRNDSGEAKGTGGNFSRGANTEVSKGP